MNPLAASQIAQMAAGKLVSGPDSVTVRRVVTDSRTVQPGDLFVALKGPNHDAHTFVREFTASAPSAVLVDQNVESEAAVIRVNDTLDGLQTLAKNYRTSLQCHVVGITGSNGKTSTKDLTAAVFGSRFSVIKTQGNLNNHIGLPLSVLSIDDSHQVAVLEMGMNHPGEIAPLAAIAAPDVAIITNIGTAHIEFMKTQEAIAQEKSELALAVSAEGVVILNANDSFTPSIAKRCKAKVITAGIEAGDVCATELNTAADGTTFLVSYQSETIPAFLPIPGNHMVGNAMLALAAGLAHGISLKTAVDTLGKIQLTSGRLESKEIGGIHFLDDSYNANPDSMLAALATLESISSMGKHVAVLGAMGELGEYAEEGHRKVGAASQDVDILVTVGKTAEWIADEAEKSAATRVIRTADTRQAAAALLTLLQPGDCVLVKGSRSARMEQVIDELALSLEPVSSATTR
ncbi:MAG TPA: UDP-N-acetylmuramoyl-tripeptide--D-alanyl-D-alanine ligase [Chthoniobacterales bacterium]|jgi:UDP-N-acetylmuramoyl-tripeptide--D-alanyl-D-alanine ligase